MSIWCYSGRRQNGALYNIVNTHKAADSDATDASVRRLCPPHTCTMHQSVTKPAQGLDELLMGYKARTRQASLLGPLGIVAEAPRSSRGLAIVSSCSARRRTLVSSLSAGSEAVSAALLWGRSRRVGDWRLSLAPARCTCAAGLPAGLAQGFCTATENLLKPGLNQNDSCGMANTPIRILC